MSFYHTYYLFLTFLKYKIKNDETLFEEGIVKKSREYRIRKAGDEGTNEDVFQV